MTSSRQRTDVERRDEIKRMFANLMVDSRTPDLPTCPRGIDQKCSQVPVCEGDCIYDHEPQEKSS